MPRDYAVLREEPRPRQMNQLEPLVITDKCGTYAGVSRHRAAGEGKCDKCKAFHREYMRKFRKKHETPERLAQRREREALVNKARKMALNELKRQHEVDYERIYASAWKIVAAQYARERKKNGNGPG